MKQYRSKTSLTNLKQTLSDFEKELYLLFLVLLLNWEDYNRDDARNRFTNTVKRYKPRIKKDFKDYVGEHEETKDLLQDGLERIDKPLNRVVVFHLNKLDQIKSENDIDKAIEEYEKKGVNNVIYSDGRRMNLFHYIEMLARTKQHWTILTLDGLKRDELGIKLVRISQHIGACPKCKPYENRVFVDDVFTNGTKEDGEYPLLSEAIENGLFHNQCRHIAISFFGEEKKRKDIPK